MRGRVFSSFYVMRDVIFLFGMAGAGLADIVDIRLLIIVAASSLLFVSAAFTLVAPGLGRVDLGRRSGSAPRRRSAVPGALGRDPASDHRRLRPACRPPRTVRPAHPRSSASAFVRAATVRDVPGGTRIIEHGDAATSAYFILDGSTTAGIPVDGRLPGASRR